MFHPLRAFPGPKLAAVTRVPYWIHYITGNQVRWIKKLHSKYGPVVRFGPNDLSYTGAQAWRDIYGYQKGRLENPKDPKFFTISRNGTRSIITVGPDEHSELRRAIAPAFSDRALKAQEPLFQRYSDSLVANIKKSLAKDGGQEAHVGIVKLLNFTTFDIMSDLTYGEALGLLESSEYTPWVALIFKAISILPIIQLIQYYPMTQALYKALETKSMKQAGLEHFQHSANRLRQRLAKGSDRPDIWTLISRDGGQSLMTTPQMESNAEVFMTAGTETTATLLSGLIYLLLTHINSMQKLIDEVRGEFTSNKEITFEALARLPYLNACIEEALRLYPPVPSALPRVAPDGGARILGQWVAPGVSLYPLQTRDQSVTDT